MVNAAQLLQLMWHQFVWATQASSYSTTTQVLICHCWPPGMQFEFALLAAKYNFYARYVNLLPKRRNVNISENFAVEYLRHQKPIMGVFLDWQCSENAVSVVNMASSVGFFSENYRWLIYDDVGDLQHFRRHFELMNLGVDTQLTYAMPSKHDVTHFVLYDVYNNGWYLGGKLNVTIDRELTCNVTGCQVTRLLSTLHARSKYGQRERLSDIKLRVAIVILSMPVNSSEERIIAYMNTITNPEIEGLQRLAFRMLVLLQEMLVSPMEYHFENAWSGGDLYGGAIGLMINRTVELVGTPFALTRNRLAILRPMVEGSSFRPICLFRTPRNPSGIEASVLLAPFTPPVWNFFGLLLLLSGVLLWCAYRVEHRLHRLEHFVPSLLTTCLLAIGTACVQGSPILPRTSGGRMISVTLLLICYLTYNYYTSAIVSTLLGTPVKSKIKSLQQLADSNLQVAVQPVVHNMVYFNTSPLAEVRRFVKRKITPQSHQAWLPLLDGILRVRDQPGFVYLFEASSSYPLVERYYDQNEICDLNEFLYRPDSRLYTQIHRNSSYKELIHLKQLRTVETGVFDKHRRYWQQKKLNCFASAMLVDVGFEYTAPLFIMLVCAYVLALLVMFLELLVHRKWTAVMAMRQCRSESDAFF